MRRFAAERVLVVATEVATPRRLLYELLLRLRRRHLSRAGWLRTRGAFEALWRETHDARPLRLQDLDGWALTPRQVQPGNVPARTGKTVA
jgi:muconolactone delta-isomerase